MHNQIVPSSPRSDFDVLYQQSYKQTLRQARRLTNNETEAEDLTQETYVRAWRAFHNYDNKRSFEAWLNRILANLAVDRWRKNSRTRTVSLDQTFQMNDTEVSLAEVMPDNTSNPEDVCLRKVVDERLAIALKKIPRIYLDTLLLIHQEGKNYAEIAKMLRCPIGTVRSRVHRGKDLLRQHLEGNPATA